MRRVSILMFVAVLCTALPAVGGEVRVVSIDSKVTESNNTWERHSWIMKVRSAGMGDGPSDQVRSVAAKLDCR